MSHDHDKKKTSTEDETKKKKQQDDQTDQGKLHEAQAHKHKHKHKHKQQQDDDTDEMTPGMGDPSKAAKDIKGQAIVVDDTKDGQTRIVINVGSDQGVTSTELDAHLTGADGQTYNVNIDKVEADKTVAWVATTHANIAGGDMWVLINPSKK